MCPPSEKSTGSVLSPFIPFATDSIYQYRIPFFLPLLRCRRNFSTRAGGHRPLIRARFPIVIRASISSWPRREKFVLTAHAPLWKAQLRLQCSPQQWAANVLAAREIISSNRSARIDATDRGGRNPLRPFFAFAAANWNWFRSPNRRNDGIRGERSIGRRRRGGGSILFASLLYPIQADDRSSAPLSFHLRFERSLNSTSFECKFLLLLLPLVDRGRGGVTKFTLTAWRLSFAARCVLSLAIEWKSSLNAIGTKRLRGYRYFSRLIAPLATFEAEPSQQDREGESPTRIRSDMNEGRACSGNRYRYPWPFDGRKLFANRTQTNLAPRCVSEKQLTNILLYETKESHLLSLR